MSALARAAVVAAVATVLTLALCAREERASCPEGQVPSFTGEKWVCVLQGGG